MAGQRFLTAHIITAFSEGMRPDLTESDWKVVFFLARSRAGAWSTRGGHLTLDGVALRMRMPLRTLKGALAHLDALEVITRRKTRHGARYQLTTLFLAECRTFHDRSERGREVLDVAAQIGLALDVVIDASLSTGLTGEPLLTALSDPDFPEGYVRKVVPLRREA